MKFLTHLFLLTSVCNVSAVREDVRLARIFGSHMVLQREIPVQIWGWAEPGEQVNVRLGGREEKATANADGSWRITFPSRPAGGPFELTVAGRNVITLTDILFGDVWLCSGQSNMEYGVGLLKNGAAVIAAANHPQIRLFAVSHAFSGAPQSDLKDEREVDLDYLTSLIGRGKAYALNSSGPNRWRTRSAFAGNPNRPPCRNILSLGGT